MADHDQGGQTVVLAALLHDIGTFARRARAPLGPGYRADYGAHGAHVLHSAQFVEQEAPPRFRGALAPVLRHRDPSDRLARIVAAADRLAAGERRPEGAAEDEAYQPLVNVLATIAADQDVPLGQGGGYRLGRLDPAHVGALFPEAARADARLGAGEYAALWGEFVAAHRRLGEPDYPTYLAGVYSLLLRYAWCVPAAASGAAPDISLFDHARVAAAIAAALHAYLAAEGPSPDAPVGAADPLALGERPCFRLVAGDLSGIQDYLYAIAEVGVGGVARRLRARSLYLQLIVEVVAQQVLAAAGVPFLNALLSSGGRFHLLLPNTPAAREAAAATQVRVDQWLLEQFGGELALNLASVELGAGELATGFGTTLARVGEALTRRKQARLREALQESGAWRESSFALEWFKGESACQSCDKRPRAGGADLCDHCLTDLAVGRRLPEAAHLALYAGERAGAVPVLGHSVVVVPAGEEVAGLPYLTLALGELDPRLAARTPLVARPIANYVPAWTPEALRARPPTAGDDAEPGAPVTFADLAMRARGRPLLGFLKADVDRLGEAFVFGLKPGRDTPSRLAAVSRALDLFFGGWLPHLLRTRFPDCYSVYAGGDDLLLAGPWDQALELATTLEADFARLTQNPGLHLSAGLLVARPGYPVARAAADAGEALEAAKEAGRDRLRVLGHTLTWAEWRLVREKWRQLAGEADSVATAFLYHLLAYARMWRLYAEWAPDHRRGSVLGLRYQPLLAYDLARNLDPRRAPGISALARGLLELRPGDAAQRTILDNLGLLAQLWILGRTSPAGGPGSRGGEG